VFASVTSACSVLGGSMGPSPTSKGVKDSYVNPKAKSTQGASTLMKTGILQGS